MYAAKHDANARYQSLGALVRVDKTTYLIRDEYLRPFSVPSIRDLPCY